MPKRDPTANTALANIMRDSLRVLSGSRWRQVKQQTASQAEQLHEAKQLIEAIMR